MKHLFVPDSHTASFPDVRPFRRGPLYQHPLTFAYGAPATALGIARHAIEAFIDIANHREITLAALGGQKVLLRRSPHGQVAISRAKVWCGRPVSVEVGERKLDGAARLDRRT